MRNVLIVSPHFPPVNAPDMQRVRLSLQHFDEFGWKPTVLAVDPRYVEGSTDPLLLMTVPSTVRVERTGALSAQSTRTLGLGDLGVRAFASLKRAGEQILSKGHTDLVYFSTTVFTSMALGRIWKRRFGTPFILDIQDMWATDYYRGRPKSEQPPKFWIANRLHRTLEPWTMKRADGIVAVSSLYIDTLCERYPRLRDVPTKTLPFGVAEADFEFVRRNPQPNRFFTPGDGLLHSVYVGRGGADMAPALKVLFGALKRGCDRRPDLFSRVRMHFVGTSYAPAKRAQKTIEPWATAFGVAGQVAEHPQRIPYFEALQLLVDADFLIVPGSDDAQYTASKIYPYVLSRKPILALFRGTSSVCHVLSETQAGTLIRLTTSPEDDRRHTCAAWSDLLARLPFSPHTNWHAFRPYLAREMTRQQCELFDEVMARSSSRVRAHSPVATATS